MPHTLILPENIRNMRMCSVCNNKVRSQNILQGICIMCRFKQHMCSKQTQASLTNNIQPLTKRIGSQYMRRLPTPPYSTRRK